MKILFSVDAPHQKAWLGAGGGFEGGFLAYYPTGCSQNVIALLISAEIQQLKLVMPAKKLTEKTARPQSTERNVRPIISKKCTCVLYPFYNVKNVNSAKVRSWKYIYRNQSEFVKNKWHNDESKVASSAFFFFLLWWEVFPGQAEGCPDLCDWSAPALMSRRSRCHLMNVADCS